MSLKLLTDACEDANQQRLEPETPLNLLFILEMKKLYWPVEREFIDNFKEALSNIHQSCVLH